MRYIKKGKEPVFFTEAKKNIDKNCGDPWLYSKSISNVSKDLRIHIAKEQNNCCAYCEEHINAENKEDCDIDHFRKRNIFKSLDDILDYNNLFVSCKNQDHCSNYKDKHMNIIGKPGKDKYNYIINPADENDKPEKYFIYNTFAKTIEPNPSLSEKDKEKAKLTIKLFQLNCINLKNARKKVLDAVMIMKKYNKSYKLEDLVNQFGFYSFIKKLLNK